MGCKDMDADRFKRMIYQDYCQALGSVENGENPDLAFRRHEDRVAGLRRLVETFEPPRLRLVASEGRRC